MNRQVHLNSEIKQRKVSYRIAFVRNVTPAVSMGTTLPLPGHHSFQSRFQAVVPA